MTEPLTTDLRYEALDLQGYTLTERLHGIALMQDPVRADIVRYAIQELERLYKLEDIIVVNRLGVYDKTHALSQVRLYPRQGK